MKPEKQQAAAAQKFAEKWQGKGYEKGDSQIFWTELLCEIYGIEKFFVQLLDNLILIRYDIEKLIIHK